MSFGWLRQEGYVKTSRQPRRPRSTFCSSNRRVNKPRHSEISSVRIFQNVFGADVLGKYSFACFFSGPILYSLFNFLGWSFSATSTARLVSFPSRVLPRGCFWANNDSPVQFFGRRMFLGSPGCTVSSGIGFQASSQHTLLYNTWAHNFSVFVSKSKTIFVSNLKMYLS